MSTPHAKPTPEQLRRAFERLRKPGWPADFEAAMASPVHASLVQCLARGLARQDEALAAAAPRPCPALAAQAPHRMRLPRLQHDPRRAASNDHDD